MEILRKTITPLTAADLVIKLPETFLNSEVEIIAFPLPMVDRESQPKRTYEEAVRFYKHHAVSFVNLPAWKREDLYE